MYIVNISNTSSYILFTVEIKNVIINDVLVPADTHTNMWINKKKCFHFKHIFMFNFEEQWFGLPKSLLPRSILIIALVYNNNLKAALSPNSPHPFKMHFSHVGGQLVGSLQTSHRTSTNLQYIHVSTCTDVRTWECGCVCVWTQHHQMQAGFN